MKITEIPDFYIARYQMKKEELEKWISENEDIAGSYQFEITELAIALCDFGIAFWSSVNSNAGARP